MNRNPNNAPEMDYYELRRRHEEYKARSSAPIRPRVEPKAASPAEDIENAQLAQPEPAAEVRAVEAAPEADRSFEAEIEAEERENARPRDGRADASENPFASFLQFASRMKGKIRPHRGDHPKDDDDLYEDIDFDQDLDADPAEPAARSADFSDDSFDPEAAPQAGDIADAEPAEPIRTRASIAPPADADYGDEAYDDENYDEYADEPYDDDAGYDDADSADAPHGFKKFLNLFITRVDPDEEMDDEPYDDGYLDDYEDEYADEADEFDAEADDSEEFGAYYRETNAARGEGVPSDIEGGHRNMDDMNNYTSEHIHQMAEGLENSGMTRRDRKSVV